MKFQVRAPFVVHIETVIERNDGGRKLKEGRTASHWAGEEIDITEAEARKHLHKLEPLDAEARALLESEYAKNRAIANNFARAPGEASLEDIVGRKVAEALAAAGVGAKR